MRLSLSICLQKLAFLTFISDSIIMDAAARRHAAQKIYLRATAALRWVNSRNAVLRGQTAHAGHAPALNQIRNTLRAVSLKEFPLETNIPPD